MRKRGRQEARGQGNKEKKLSLSPSLPLSLSPGLPFNFLLFTLLLSSCTFLYIPPLLPSQEVPPILELSGSKGLSLNKGILELSLTLSQVPEEGWIAVQWYSPDNKEVASDSLWIKPDQAGFSPTYALPGQVMLEPGDWRVIVSFQNSFIRQFSVAVPEPENP